MSNITTIDSENHQMSEDSESIWYHNFQGQGRSCLYV